MPEAAQRSTEVSVNETLASQDAPRSPLRARLKFLAFSMAVVAAECLAAYLFLPAAPDASAMAPLSPEIGPSSELVFAADEESPEIPEELTEVDLGEFTVTSYQPISGTSLRIDFRLFGTVAANDREEFDTAIGEQLHRIRDQVIVIVRSSELNDVTDAGLGLIKRKILEKTNRSLGKPFLQAVIFSDFSFIEQ
jgi:flagellar basal body-associated protein FliL